MLALASAPLSGQTLDQFKRQAAQADPSYNSRVVATEHGSAATVVHSMQAQPSGTKIPGYRVRIFLDNGQNARASANGAIAVSAKYIRIFRPICRMRIPISR